MAERQKQVIQQAIQKTVHVIGGGLAGSEAAWQAASCGVPVVLHEMRPTRATEAHHTDGLAELVCSNSLRSDDRDNNAVGLLHEEMRRLDSLIMRAADANQVPAGGALAVDRDGFSAAVTEALDRASADRDRARGSGAAAAGLGQRHRRDRPADLAGARRRHRRGSPARTRSPSSMPSRRSCIATRSTWTSAWFQSRYDKAGPGGSGADYINCPMDRATIRRLRRGAGRGRQDRVPGLGKDHALFRRLPADRGDGRTRRGDAAPRPDEAVRPDQSARPADARPTPSCSFARTTSSARSTTWSASRPS